MEKIHTDPIVDSKWLSMTTSFQLEDEFLDTSKL